VESSTPWLLVAVASAGNILGSVINWLLGRGLERFRDRRWFPVKEPELAKAQRWYQRFGKWSLLMSWAPVIGDPLTLVAGVMREPFPVFLALVSIAKIARYVLVALIVLQLAG
jgi:membrane protein YqaA with SNARE-associated domain